jgi:hypothetical protein
MENGCIDQGRRNKAAAVNSEGVDRLPGPLGQTVPGVIELLRPTGKTHPGVIECDAAQSVLAELRDKLAVNKRAGWNAVKANDPSSILSVRPI